MSVSQEFLRQVPLGRILKRLYCKKYVSLPSALYILSNELRQSRINFSVVPSLPFDKLFKDVGRLEQNLSLRGLEVNVRYLSSLQKEFVDLYSQVCEIKRLISTLSKQIEKSVEGKNTSSVEVEDSNEFKNLTERLSEIMNERYCFLEENFVLPVVRLPNLMHPSCQRLDEDVYTYLQKPLFNFIPKSHKCLGAIRDNDLLSEQLYFTHSPPMAFLVNSTALLEMACSSYILEQLELNEFRLQSNGDFARADIIEGCGLDPKDHASMYRIQDPYCPSDNKTLHLVGGAHLCAFATDLSKVELLNPLFPFKIACTGRIYTPTKMNLPSLFNTNQSTCVTSVVLHHEIQEQEVLDHIVRIITEIYTKLGVHFKIVKYGVPKLHPYESLSHGIQMFSPSRNEYVEIGRVSLCGDYISRRLQMVSSIREEGSNVRKGSYLSMIYVKFVDIQKWIGCLMENTQTDEGGYTIPKVLVPFMYDSDYTYSKGV